VQKKRSPWVYVGLGCGIALLLLCGIGVTFVIGVGSFARGWAEDMADPARRETKARKEALATLGALPEGYSAAVTFGIPMLFDMILFVDAPLLADGGVPAFTRQFVFMRMMETDRTNEMKAFFESSDGGTFQSEGMTVDSKEELARGSFQHQGRKVSWVACCRARYLGDFRGDSIRLAAGIANDRAIPGPKVPSTSRIIRQTLREPAGSARRAALLLGRHVAEGASRLPEGHRRRRRRP
jgi:hypothetical protein